MRKGQGGLSNLIGTVFAALSRRFVADRSAAVELLAQEIENQTGREKNCPISTEVDEANECHSYECLPTAFVSEREDDDGRNDERHNYQRNPCGEGAFCAQPS